MLFKTNWESFKQIYTDNSDPTIYYTTTDNQYEVIQGSRSNIYWTLVRDSSDITEFETTYKPSAINVLSFDDGISKATLSSMTDDADVVTAINNIGVSVALARFRPMFYFDKTSQDITSSYKTLANITQDGKLDSISINFSGGNNIVKLTVDDIVIFEQSISDLDNTSIYNVGSGHYDPNIIKAVSSGKGVQFLWTNPVDFTTSLKIEAKDISGGPTKVLQGITICYRIRIV